MVRKCEFWCDQRWFPLSNSCFPDFRLFPVLFLHAIQLRRKGSYQWWKISKLWGDEEKNLRVPLGLGSYSPPWWNIPSEFSCEPCVVQKKLFGTTLVTVIFLEGIFNTNWSCFLLDYWHHGAPHLVQLKPVFILLLHSYCFFVFRLLLEPWSTSFLGSTKPVDLLHLYCFLLGYWHHGAAHFLVQLKPVDLLHFFIFLLGYIGTMEQLICCLQLKSVDILLSYFCLFGFGWLLAPWNSSFRSTKASWYTAL